jgi:hypothetical protein
MERERSANDGRRGGTFGACVVVVVVVERQRVEMRQAWQVAGRVR